MARMTDEEIDQMFLRSASIHEAGHFVVARALGVKAAEIELRRVNGGPDERTVVGRIYYDYPRGFSSPEFEHALPFVSLAGFVAEAVDEERDGATPVGLGDTIVNGFSSMSASDYRGAGEITYVKLWRTLYLVRKNWAEIERVAAEARDAFEAGQGRQQKRKLAN